MWKTTALLGLLALSLAQAQMTSDVMMMDKTVGTFVMDDTMTGTKPAIILISETGMLNDFVLEQAKTMVTAVGAVAMVVDVLKLDVSAATELSGFTMEEMSMAVSKAIDTVKTCEKCTANVDTTKISVVGYGVGANAVLAAASKQVNFQAGIAYTPMTTSSMVPTSFGMVTPRLLIMYGYDEVANLAALETALGDDTMSKYEVFMQYGTKVHFNVVGNVNYAADQAARALAQSASFLTAVFEGKFATIGTSAPLSTLTPETVSYKDGTTDISGYVLRPTGVSKAPAVVVVPAWKGFESYAIERMQYLAAAGYVSMSANIYNLPMGYSIEDQALRVGNVTEWREPGNAVKGEAFANRIDAARDYIAGQDYVSGVSAIGFCFGGTGVYNTYRFGPVTESEFAVQASFHGNMMATRDFTGSPTVSFKGYLAMYVGTLDAGESGDTMTAHLKDLSDNGGKWEMTRYSGAVHGFTEWGGNGYQAWGEGRSFESFMAVMKANNQDPATGSASTLTASSLIALLAAAATMFMARY